MYTTMRKNIPPIRDYAHAVKVEAETKPVRGTDIKPVGLRRNKHQQILRNGDDIICRLYQTDVITYKPNGEIVVRIDCWASQTTVAFLSDLLSQPFHIFDHQMWMNEMRDGEVYTFPLHSSGDNIFTRNAKGYLTFHNPRIPVTHKINRKNANNVRRRHKDFKVYVERMFKVRQDDRGAVRIGKEELMAVFGSERRPNTLEPSPTRKPKAEDCAAFLKLITKRADEDKTEDYYKAFLWLCFGAHRFVYSIIYKGTVFDLLDKVLLYTHRDEVFDGVEHYGKEIRDTYGKFFDF